MKSGRAEPVSVYKGLPDSTGQDGYSGLRGWIMYLGHRLNQDRVFDMDGIIRAWGKILAGDRPALSVEITRECPLRCPGCYAFLDDHLGDSVGLRQLGDYQGQALVDRFFQLIDEHDPLHVSIVGGEPLVRYRELNQILPRLSERGVHVQVVTSAVDPFRRSGRGYATSRSPSRSTGCSRNTMCGGHRRPTTGFSNMSSATRSASTAR